MCPDDPPHAVPVPGDARLRDVDEGYVVARLAELFRGAAGDGVLVGIGDDAALVTQPSGSVVATTDTMVRGQDWRDDWSSAHDVGGKLVTQNVADVAAMGAAPTGLLLTVVADASTPLSWVLGLGQGVADRARSYGVPVVGGDLSSAPEGVVTVSITALGDLQGREPVRRTGARPGDVVAVGGSLGWSGAGLALYLAGQHREDGPPHGWDETQKARDLVRWFHRSPVCPAGSGPRAADAGATSMIDVSDGLSRDAGRIASASGVRLALERALLEQHVLDDDPTTLALGREGAFEQVLHGGEEHSLLATFPAGTPMTFDDACRWMVVGRVEEPGPGERPGVTLDGEPLVTRAWDHFGG